MAMIPTIMARTPSRINEVDDDRSTDAGRGVDVDVDMTGVPFVRLGFPFVWPGCVAAAFGPRCGGIDHRRGRPSQYSWAGARAEGCENMTAGRRRRGPGRGWRAHRPAWQRQSRRR